MFEADHLYLDFVGEDTFYGFLARHRAEIFRDEDFDMLNCRDNGRNSVPPSLLASALLLQAHDQVSDAETKARADHDLRGKKWQLLFSQMPEFSEWVIRQGYR